ncbi:MAG: SNF2 helicase associated domain-containing protein, partial [Pontiella sp.]|nr:SNF2 helicase associated domain-containing protein [Pontiella sp.]
MVTFFDEGGNRRMRENLPYTKKKLKDWAGWRAYRDGKALFERGVVEKVSYDHPYITGLLNLGPRGMRSKFEVLKNGLVENHCPCRDNQERGLICSHLVAMGLEVIRRNSDPAHNPNVIAETSRIDRIAKAVEGSRIQRVGKSAPGAVKARLIVELAENWLEQLPGGKISTHLSIEYDKARVSVSDAPTDVPFSFSRRDETVLRLFEDVSRGALKSMPQLSVYDLINLLRASHGHVVHQKGREDGCPVNGGMLDMAMQMDMNRENGELLLRLMTTLPDGLDEEDSAYIIGSSSGWIYSAGQFWPVSSILPPALQNIYRGETTISREGVPAFLMTELSQIEKVMEVRTDITPELFHMKPAKPAFRLVVKGSPASLAAKLYARYNDEVELIAGRADMRGNFAIPDPTDLLRYRIRNMTAEKEAVEKMETVGFVGRAGDTLRNIVGPREVLNFLGTGVPQIRRFGWQVELEGRVKPFAESADYVMPIVHVDEAETGDYFDVSYEYDAGTASISERDIQSALMKGDSFIQRNGRTILLDGDAILQAQEVFQDCAIGTGDKPESFRMSHVYGSYVESSLTALDGIDIKATPSWIESAKRQNTQDSVEPVQLSPRLKGTLRTYQHEGVNWLRFLEKRGFCGILADEMGLGKTIQTLAWIQLGRSDESHQRKPALIICPTSLVENWHEEASRFTPNLKVLILHGTERHRRWKKIDKTDLVITSYALMRRDIEKHLEF